MQSRQKQVPASVRVTNFNGVITDIDMSGIDSITVTNGNVQGDKKSPNPFRFDIRQDIPGPFQSRQEFVSSANPSTGVYDIDVTTSVGTTCYDFAADNLAYVYESQYQSMFDEAFAKLVSRVRDNGNLAVDALEASKTRVMIRNATRVWQQVLRVKRAVFRLNAQEAASLWLEARYGWMPLVYSTYDILDNMIQYRKRNAIRVTGRARRRRSGNVSSGNGTFSNPALNLRSELSERFQIVGSFEIPDSEQLYDYTSLNPALIAWELVPLSFVADWFVNVGQCLENWENYMLLKQRWRGGYQTYTSFRKEVRSAAGLTVAPQMISGYYRRQVTDIQYQRLYKTLNRVVLPDLPQPGGLRLDVQFGAKRLTDAAALIRLAFR